MATRKTAKAAKTVKTKKPAKKARISKAPAPEMTPEEVKALEIQVDSSKRAENSWLKMTDTTPEDDQWSDTEESLIRKPAEGQHAARSWKHFSK